MSVRFVPHPEVLSLVPNRDGAPGPRFAVVEASAGTGKTFTLEHLVVDRVIRGAPIPSILVVTFTDKATREMKKRVRDRIRSVLYEPLDGDASSERSSNEHTGNACSGDVDKTHTWRIGPEEEARLSRAWLDFERAPISTIHGFCRRTLSDYAFRSRRPFAQSLVEPRRAFAAAFRDALRYLLAEDSQDSRVLFDVLQTMDVSLLEQRLYRWHQVDGDVRPSWEPAAFVSALKRAADPVVLRTFVDKSVRSDVASRGQEALIRLEKIAARFEQKGDVLAALREVENWRTSPLTSQDTTSEWLLAKSGGMPIVGHRLTDLILRSPSRFGLLLHRVLPRVVERLEADKSARAQIDFDDMLKLVREGLTDVSSGPLVSALRHQYAHAYVDEFQDTDNTQWAIFRRLFVDDGATGTLTVIGDPKQAIYAFRGADIDTYHEAKAVLLRDGALFHGAPSHGAPSDVPISPNEEVREAVQLRTCYRSTPQLVTAFNQIFAEDTDFSPQERERDNTRSGFFRGSKARYLPVSAGTPKKRLVDTSGLTRDDELVPEAAASVCLWQVVGSEAPSAHELRRALGRRIAEEAHRIAEGKVRFRVGHKSRALSYRDIFVLVRSAREGKVYAEIFEACGVPYSLVRDEGLFATEEAQAFLDLLRAIESPSARSARMRAWLTPFFGGTTGQLEMLSRESELMATLHGWRRRITRGQVGVLSALLTESGLTRRLLSQVASESEQARLTALTNYEHLVEVLQSELGAAPRLSECVALLAAFIEGRAEPVQGSSTRSVEARDAVQVLTMHKSKGLEAPIVFLAGGFTKGHHGSEFDPVVVAASRPEFIGDREQVSTAKPGSEAQRQHSLREAWLPPLPPNRQAEADARALGEDERLFYVALTRAEGRVILPYFGAAPISASDDGPAIQKRFERLHGPYRHLSDRLEQLVLRGFVDEKNVTFEHIDVEIDAPTAPNKKTAVLRPIDNKRPDFLALLEARRGHVLTSYSKIKASSAQEMLPDSLEAFSQREVVTNIKNGDDDLPGGAVVGVFVHDLLETLPYVDAAMLSFDNWWEKHGEAIERRARRDGLVASAKALSLMAYRALRRPLELGAVELAGGLCTADRAIAEVEVFFPIPEDAHPSFRDGHQRTQSDSGECDSSFYRIERGVIRGYIDWVFEAGGKTFFLDWKTDRVGALGNDEKTLMDYAMDSYALQARIYTIAVLRLLNVKKEADYNARFGGLVYAFLRPMGALVEETEPTINRGVVFMKPDWETICAWEEALRNHVF